MRIPLRNDPKVLQIASAIGEALGVRERSKNFRTAVCVGMLHHTWGLADMHSQDGSLPGYTRADLDEEVGCPGWSEALESVGWLEVSASGIAIPDFLEHNGESSKRRAAEAKSKRADRPSRAKGPAKVRENLDPGSERERTPSSSLSLSLSVSSGEGIQGEGDRPAAAPAPALPASDDPPQDPPAWHPIVTSLVVRLVSSAAGGGGLDGRRQWAYQQRLAAALELVQEAHPDQREEATAAFGRLVTKRLETHDPREGKAIAALNGWLMGESGADLLPMLRRECAALKALGEPVSARKPPRVPDVGRGPDRPVGEQPGPALKQRAVSGGAA